MDGLVEGMSRVPDQARASVCENRWNIVVESGAIIFCTATIFSRWLQITSWLSLWPWMRSFVFFLLLAPMAALISKVSLPTLYTHLSLSDSPVSRSIVLLLSIIVWLIASNLEEIWTDAGQVLIMLALLLVSSVINDYRHIKSRTVAILASILCLDLMILPAGIQYDPFKIPIAVFSVYVIATCAITETGFSGELS